MRAAHHRDEQTLAIVRALLVFVAVVIAAGLLLWLADEVIGLPERLGRDLQLSSGFVGAVVAVGYLVREQR